MKKFLAVVLSLVIALSCAGVAFAASEGSTVKIGDVTYVYCSCGTLYNLATDYDAYLTCSKSHKTTAPATEATIPDVVVSNFVCPDCGRVWANSKDYNDCISSHRGDADRGDSLEYYFDKYIVGKASSWFDNQNVNTVTSITGIIDYMVGVFEDSGVLDVLKDIINRILAYIESKLYSEAEVAGAVDELEAKVGTLGLGGTVLENIKAAINSLKQKIKDLYAGERATIEETEAEAPADTGSTTIGVAAFAAVSIAVAAAFVCTRKKSDEE